MTWHKRFASRVHALFQKRHLEEELDEELLLHLEMQTEDNIEGGMSPEEARCAARRSFGGVEQVKEEYRDRWCFLWLDTLWRDLAYAVRTLRRSPGFTTVAVLSLALGIGANTTIFTIVNAVLLRPPPFKDPDRLVVITEGSGYEVDELDRPQDSYRFAWHEESQLLENIVAADPYSAMVTVVDRSPGENLEIWRGGGDIFQVLGIEPILGRTFQPSDFLTTGPTGWANAVLLSHRLWERRFGSDPNVVGKPIRLPQMGNPIIIGVMPPGTRVFPWQRGVELWAAVDWTKRKNSRSRWQCAVGRLKPGVSLEQVREELEIIARRADEAAGVKKGARINVHPLQKWSAGSYSEALYPLSGAVGFLLLIACANVATLFLGRAHRRGREMLTRAALGASRRRLIQQLMVESLLLSVTAGAAGILLAHGGVRLFLLWVPHWYLPEGPYPIDASVLTFTLVVTLMGVSLFGLAPSLHSSRVDLGGSLRRTAGGHVTGANPQSSAPLVVSQVALAVVLLVGAGLMINTVINRANAEPGFNPDRLIMVPMSLNGPRYLVNHGSAKRVTTRVEPFYRGVMEKIKEIPGVEMIGAGHRAPTRGTFSRNPVRIFGALFSPDDNEPQAAINEITKNYFRVCEIPLIKGRYFTSEDTAGEMGVAIINRAFAAKYLDGKEPLGIVVQATFRSLRHDDSRNFMDQPRRIVGVVGNSTWRRGDRDPPPEIYYPMSQRHALDYPAGTHAIHTMKTLLVRTHLDPASLEQPIRKAISELDPEVVPGHIETMRRRLVAGYSKERFWLQVLVLFSAAALSLAAIGLYGVISYSVTQRTHEFGIRMALGAERSSVLKVVLADGLRLSLIGIGIGIAAALGATRLIESQLYGVTPTDPATFTAVAAVLLAVALLASYLPARRATQVDPMQALRYE